MPKAKYNDRYEGKVDLWKKMQNSQVLTDAEMKQLFHAIDMQELGSKNTKAKLEAELMRLYAEEQLARNVVASAERDSDGNMLLYGVPVRPEDALYFAKQDIQHFQDTDRHLMADQIRSQAYQRQTTGTRPPKESPAAYQLLERSYETAAKNEQQRQDREHERQRLINLYTDEQLKAIFGPDLRVAAWQLGLRKGLNEILYGLHNIGTYLTAGSEKPNYKKPVKLTPQEMSLEARFPTRTLLGQQAANSAINSSIGRVTPPQNLPFLQNSVKGQAIGGITGQIKKQSNKDQRRKIN